MLAVILPPARSNSVEWRAENYVRLFFLHDEVHTMQESVSQGLPDAENVDDLRKPYEPPELIRLGTIHELTNALGVVPTDNDEFQPGSSP
jgi:hypothetical protein